MRILSCCMCKSGGVFKREIVCVRERRESWHHSFFDCYNNKIGIIRNDDDCVTIRTPIICMKIWMENTNVDQSIGEFFFSFFLLHSSCRRLEHRIHSGQTMVEKHSSILLHAQLSS